MPQIVRQFQLSEGRNNLALSAEHKVIGALQDQSGAILLTILENTDVSDTEEGLVWRDVYVVSVGVSLGFDPANVMETFLVPAANSHYRTKVVFVFPGRRG